MFNKLQNAWINLSTKDKVGLALLGGYIVGASVALLAERLREAQLKRLKKDLDNLK